MEPTKEEQKVIASLNRLYKKWPASLWLLAAAGSLYVMRCGKDGEQVVDDLGEFDQNYILISINIPSDGCNW